MQSPGKEVKRSAVTTIRRMSTADVHRAHSILKESPEASIWSEVSLLESISHGFSWAAEQDGLTAGFAIGRLAADQFEILNLAVGKAFRKQGIATQLVNSMLEDAHHAGARQAFLEVRASNEAAIALYGRLGFRLSGRRVNYYHDPVEDALLLVWHSLEKNP